ncbi:MAG: twin-arginine translocation signal domain-containing protein, partial [Reyranella sp.]|nr:twin-arginine translocation signal domain-containing protein [Reyranella sp.]
MKRRSFMKTTAAAGAAATAAPAIWSEAKAQARNETLLLVTESPPNSMDIHGVGTNRPAYEVSWNCYDRLITYGVKKDA